MAPLSSSRRRERPVVTPIKSQANQGHTCNYPRSLVIMYSMSKNAISANP